jgi:hypothetical protein
MASRTKLLVHFRRLSSVLGNAIHDGTDRIEEHPEFVHHACAFYLIGCLAYLESESGKASWDTASSFSKDFDAFVCGHPAAPRKSFASRGINRKCLKALSDIRNAVAHVGGDLSKLDRTKKSENVVQEIQQACIPGVILKGSVVSLEQPFLEFVRLAAFAVRSYHGEK